MKIELALPPLKRDLRLDLFRGLANWAMFLGHVLSTVLAWCSFRNYGFSDGADCLCLSPAILQPSYLREGWSNVALYLEQRGC